jgi:membrane protease YdiL (CAAX protease family)
VLGLSAGIGEELTMRGALQPRLGLAATALLFASLHVQYSWFGITVIFLLGLVLGLLRKHTNTSVAMAVHALYDMAAVLSIPRT